MDENKKKIDKTEEVLRDIKKRTENLKERHDATSATIDNLNSEIKHVLDKENKQDNKYR